MSNFTLTGAAVAAESGSAVQYVSRKANEGLVPHIVASNGMRLYPPEAVAIVRRLKAEGMARRFVAKVA